MPTTPSDVAAAYCVDVDGACLEGPWGGCRGLLLAHAIELLLLGLCMRRVLTLAGVAPRPTPTTTTRSSTVSGCSYSCAQGLLATAAAAVSAATAALAFPLHATSAIVLSAAITAAASWLWACALVLERRRVAPPQRGRFASALVLAAFAQLWQLSAWRPAHGRPFQPTAALVLQLLTARALLFAALAVVSGATYATTAPPPTPASGGRASPFDRASPLARVAYLWIAPIIALGQRRRLELDDVPELPRRDRTDAAAARFRRALAAELAGGASRRPSLLRLCRRLYGWEIAGFALWSTCNKALGLGSPLLIKLFLDWAAEAPAPSLATGYVLAGLMLVRSVASAVSSTQYSLAWQRLDLRIRAGLVAAVYDRVLGLGGPAAASPAALGRLTNLVSVDIGRVVGLPGTVFDLVLLPLKIAFALALLAHEVSYAFVGGVVVLGTMLPIQTLLGAKVAAVTAAMLAVRDQRVALTAETLRGVRTLKLLGWLDGVLARLATLRAQEMARLQTRKYLDALCVFFWAATPVIVQTSVFVTVVYAGRDLSAANAFTAVALLDRLIYPMNYFPWIVNGFLEARVSALRLRAFLFADDDDDHYETFSPPPLLPPRKQQRPTQMQAPSPSDGSSSSTSDAAVPRVVVEIRGATFEWWGASPDAETDKDDDQDDQSSAATPLLLSSPIAGSSSFQLHIDRLDLEANVPYVVCGGIGAGKSSLLLGLLGEMPRCEGSLRRWRPRAAYAPQTPWLFRASVRDNITMGEPTVDPTAADDDRALYERVLHACDLDADLGLRRDGDATLVCEHGANFSGGQRIRINLARALYQRTKLYLLDDPLSGLDPVTARAVVRRCFGSGIGRPDSVFPADAAVVVTTHAIHLIDEFPANTRVLVLDDGELVESGTLGELRTAAIPGRFMRMRLAADATTTTAQESKTTVTATATTESETDTVPPSLTAAVDDDDRVRDGTTDEKGGDNPQNEEEEHRASGAVERGVWLRYGGAIGWPLTVAILVSLGVMQGSRNGLDAWIAYYTNHNGQHDVAPRRFADVLLWITLVNGVAVLFRSFLFALGGLRAARALYTRLSSAVFHAPLSFFDATPVGRVLNRLSGDTYAVDESLPFILNIFLKDLADVVGGLVIIFFGNRYVLVLLVPLSWAYQRLQGAYRPTSRHLKRLEATTQSPLLAMFTETLDGLRVLRALRLEAHYATAYGRCLHTNQRVAFLGANASAWLGIRLDLLGVVVTAFVAFFAVLEFQVTGRVRPGVLGLTLTYALPIVSKLNAILGSFVDTERQMIAVERLEEYAGLPREGHASTSGDAALLARLRACAAPPVPQDWPSAGHVLVRDASVSYGPMRALHRVSCEIRGGEHVGICGRTGAGKSSFLHALFRAVELDTATAAAGASGGSIAIDGLDLRDVPLEVLRRRLTYVPQEVVLFAGSVRSNLDPDGAHPDAALWEALREGGGLDVAVAQLPQGLDTPIGGGATLSKGQAQLLCVVRALLRRSRVLCVDEATASIDYATEARLTKTLRSAFAGSTIIVIAHRLRTIMDCDRVFVFDQGRIVETGSPCDLLADRHSRFFALAKEDAGAREAASSSREASAS